eukprot:gene1513-1671_t
MSLAEAHQLYLEENPDYSIGRSKFFQLRPKNVKLFDKMPHSVCVCMYHENIRLLLNALENCTELPSSTTAFTNSIWQKNDKKIIKVEVNSIAEDTFHELKNQLKPFLMHVYAKRQQAAFMEEITQNVDGKTIAMHIDFSENATLACQNEIQSAHWQHSQATLTAQAWVDTGKEESTVIVSDDLDHTKLAVYTFVSKLISILREKYPEFERVHVFSDGPSSQFKPRFLFSNLYPSQKQFHCEICWHFLATSNGKGNIDGLGRTVKRSIWRYVRSGNGFATTPQMFHELALQRNPDIKILFISKNEVAENEVAENEVHLNAHWDNTILITNTHKIHFVRAKGSSNLLVAGTSNARKLSEVRILKNKIPEDDKSSSDEEQITDESNSESEVAVSDGLDIAIGDWIVVKYEGEMFPGEITEIGGADGNEIRTDVMERSGKFWKWPSKRQYLLFLQRCCEKDRTTNCSRKQRTVSIFIFLRTLLCSSLKIATASFVFLANFLC